MDWGFRYDKYGCRAEVKFFIHPDIVLNIHENLFGKIPPIRSQHCRDIYCNRRNALSRKTAINRITWVWKEAQIANNNIISGANYCRWD